MLYIAVKLAIFEILYNTGANFAVRTGFAKFAA